MFPFEWRAGFDVTTDLFAGIRRHRCRAASIAAVLAISFWTNAPAPAAASTLAPPLLDVTRQCETIARRNVRAMSECVVAESEARAEILQKWSKFADADVDRCVKLGRKSRRYPYSMMAKCLAVEPVDMRTTATAPSVK